MLFTIIYLVLVLFLSVLVVWNLYETKSLSEKAMGAIVLIMLLLRLIFIK